MKRLLTRLSVLLPLLSALFLLIYASKPHLWFVYNGQAHETLDWFALSRNTWDSCTSLLRGSEKGSATAFSFAYLMTGFLILAWAALVQYALFALFCAGCGSVALSESVPGRTAHRAKKILYLVCPNKTLYLAESFLPLLPALLPEVLVWFYREAFNYSMSVHSLPCADWLLALLCVVATVASLKGCKDLFQE